MAKKKRNPNKKPHDRYDAGNASVEILKIKKSIFSFSDDPDIEKYEWQEGLTYRAFLTRDDKPSILGWKIIRLALMGKSWIYMQKVTGISKHTITYLFRTNPVIRQAVLDLSHEVAEEAKTVLLRSLHRSVVSLVKLAAGESKVSTADKQKVQLEAIKEHFNRIGFAIPTAGKGAPSGNLTIRIEGEEARDLGLLITRRRERLPAGGGDGDGRDPEEDQEERETNRGDGNYEEPSRRSGDNGSVDGSGDVIEGEFTSEPVRSGD